MSEVFETFYLLAAMQGVLLSLVLVTKRENHAANRILALATLALSVELIVEIYYSRGWYRQYPHAMGITYPFPYLYGPLFFLYARLVSKKVDRLHPHDLLHFLPALIVYVAIAPVFLYSGEEKIRFVVNMMMGTHPPMYSIIEGAIPIQGIIYTVLTIKTVAGYELTIRDNFSTIEMINLRWLRYLILGMIVIWPIVTMLFVADIIVPGHSNSHALLHIPISLLIYSIGYMGLRQPEIFLAPTEKAGPEKYRRSGLSEASATEIQRKLLIMMESEKAYIDQELTLQKLAGRMNVSSHNLSEVINSAMQQSYYDFVNHHRVEEFKRRVADPANQHYNLLSIAFDAGFKSKGTFNSIFKKFTGMTPSEYKSSIDPAPVKEVSA